MYYVYVLLSLKGENFYIGFTDDIKKRLSLHNKGLVHSTKHRRPLELIYYEYYRNGTDATMREKFLKSSSGHRYISKQLKNYLQSVMRKYLGT